MNALPYFGVAEPDLHPQAQGGIAGTASTWQQLGVGNAPENMLPHFPRSGSLVIAGGSATLVACAFRFCTASGNTALARSTAGIALAMEMSSADLPAAPNQTLRGARLRVLATYPPRAAPAGMTAWKCRGNGARCFKRTMLRFYARNAIKRTEAGDAN